MALSRIREIQLQEERMRPEHYHLPQLWDFHCQRMTDTRNEISDAIKKHYKATTVL